jgi:hypothetical protein
MLGAALGLHFGGFVSSAAAKAAKAYSVRVIADGGTIEGYQCMVQKLKFLFTRPLPALWQDISTQWQLITQTWN